MEPDQLQQGSAAEPQPAEVGVIRLTDVQSPTAAATAVTVPEVAAVAGRGAQEQGQRQQHQHRDGTSTDNPPAELEHLAAAGAEGDAAEQQEGGAAAALGAVNKASKAKIHSFLRHAERVATTTTHSYQPLQEHPRVMAGAETAVLTLTVLPIYPSKQRGGTPFSASMHGCDAFTPEDQRLLGDMLAKTGRFVRSCMARQQDKLGLQVVGAEMDNRSTMTAQQLQCTRRQQGGSMADGGASSSSRAVGGEGNSRSGARREDPLSVEVLAAAAPTKARTALLRELFKVLRRHGKLPSMASGYCSSGARPVGRSWDLWVVRQASRIEAGGSNSGNGVGSSISRRATAGEGDMGPPSAGAAAAASTTPGSIPESARLAADAPHVAPQQGGGDSAADAAGGGSSSSHGPTPAAACGCGNSCAAGRQAVGWPEDLPFFDGMAHTAVEAAQKQLLEVWAPSRPADFCAGEVKKLVELYEDAMCLRGFHTAGGGASCGGAIADTALEEPEMGAEAAAAAVVAACATTGGDTAVVAATADEQVAVAAAACGSMAANATVAAALTAGTAAAAAGSGADSAAATAGPAAASVDGVGASSSSRTPRTATAGQGTLTGPDVLQTHGPAAQRVATTRAPTAASKQGSQRRRRRVPQPLPSLFVPLETSPGVEEADARDAGPNKKRVRWADDQQQQLQQQELLQRQPCTKCHDPERDQLICEHCMRCWHLECLEPPLSLVPPGTWLCMECNSPERMAAVKEALTYHSRWVVSTFWGIKGQYWGQLSYSSMGRLAIQYQDGERWDGISMAQVNGNELLKKHRSIKLQPAAVEVPQEVMRVFVAQDWLVEESSE